MLCVHHKKGILIGFLLVLFLWSRHVIITQYAPPPQKEKNIKEIMTCSLGTIRGDTSYVQPTTQSDYIVFSSFTYLYYDNESHFSSS